MASDGGEQKITMCHYMTAPYKTSLLKKYKSLKRNESHTALAALEALSREQAFAAW